MLRTEFFNFSGLAGNSGLVGSAGLGGLTGLSVKGEEGGRREGGEREGVKWNGLWGVLIGG